MAVDRRNRVILEESNMKAIGKLHPSWSALFDIRLVLQKALGNNHTLAFQGAVNGVVYGVTVNVGKSGAHCRLLAFVDNKESEIHWPPLEYLADATFTLTNFADAFDFKALLEELCAFYNPQPAAFFRRRLVSVFHVESGPPKDQATLLQEALDEALAAQAEYAPAEAIHASLGVHLSAQGQVEPVVENPIAANRVGKFLGGERESPVPTSKSVRAKLHTVMSVSRDGKDRKTIELPNKGVAVVEYLLRHRAELEKRDARAHLRKSPVKPGVNNVLYISAIKEGLWVYAGLEGLQHRNRIFIPFQLEGSFVKIPPDAPWDLIFDMLGLRL